MSLKQTLALLPTPTEQDGSRNSTAPPSQANRNTPGLASTLALLPTPSASLANYDERPETWLARAEQLKAKHGNGNGAGMPLGIAVKLLPTPTSASYQQGGTAAEQTTIKRELGLLPSSGEPTSPPSDDGSGSTGLRLSPCFEEWMLGLPQGWSDPDCPLSAMEFRSRSPRSSAPTSSSERPSA